MKGHLLKEADLNQQAKEKIASANIMNHSDIIIIIYKPFAALLTPLWCTQLNVFALSFCS